MQHPHFFGYGSLVNRRTHDFAPVTPARMTGWRRAWRATARRRVAFLTAIPDPGSVIDGLIAPVPNDDWAALDQREAAYARHDVTPTVEHAAGAVSRIAVYAIEDAQMLPPSDAHPVLLSYLDVVIQGFLSEFGPEGAARFFETTEGWDTPILDDRSAPLYPRAQRLTSVERAAVDDGIARLGCRVVRDHPDLTA